MKQVTDYFGCLVFNDRVMKSKLSSDVYKKLKKTINDGKEELQRLMSEDVLRDCTRTLTLTLTL